VHVWCFVRSLFNLQGTLPAASSAAEHCYFSSAALDCQVLFFISLIFFFGAALASWATAQLEYHLTPALSIPFSPLSPNFFIAVSYDTARIYNLFKNRKTEPALNAPVLFSMGLGNW